jgi:hypothetical protein
VEQHVEVAVPVDVETWPVPCTSLQVRAAALVGLPKQTLAKLTVRASSRIRDGIVVPLRSDQPGAPPGPR